MFPLSPFINSTHLLKTHSHNSARKMWRAQRSTSPTSTQHRQWACFYSEMENRKHVLHCFFAAGPPPARAASAVVAMVQMMESQCEYFMYFPAVPITDLSDPARYRTLPRRSHLYLGETVRFLLVLRCRDGVATPTEPGPGTSRHALFFWGRARVCSQKKRVEAAGFSRNAPMRSSAARVTC